MPARSQQKSPKALKRVKQSETSCWSMNAKLCKGAAMQKGEISAYPCSSMQITVKSLSPKLWPALENLFGPRGACNDCWCMYWRIGRNHKKRPPRANKKEFPQLVARGPAPGLVALNGALAV